MLRNIFINKKSLTPVTNDNMVDVKKNKENINI